MKSILEIGAYKSGNLRREMVDPTDLDATVNENTAIFVGRTIVTGLIGGRSFSDCYQISKAYLKRQSQWRMVAFQRARVAKTHSRVANHVHGAAA